jgi:hypothetical protein
MGETQQVSLQDTLKAEIAQGIYTANRLEDPLKIANSRHLFLAAVSPALCWLPK